MIYATADSREATGQVQQAQADDVTKWIWRVWTQDPPTNKMPLYALSEPLVIGGDTDPNTPTVDAGDDMITWSGEPVTLAPDATAPRSHVTVPAVSPQVP